MQALIGFVALAVILVATYWGLQIGGSVAQVITLVIGGGLTYALARFQERERYQRELDAKVLSDKRLLYKTYLDIIRSYGNEPAKQLKPSEIASHYLKFNFNAILTASDDVIRAHIAFMAAPTEFNLPALGDVVIAMRRDSGVKGTLTPIEAMTALLNDMGAERPHFDAWSSASSKAEVDPDSTTSPPETRGTLVE
jgi:hypothetical protein